MTAQVRPPAQASEAFVESDFELLDFGNCTELPMRRVEQHVALVAARINQRTRNCESNRVVGVLPIVADSCAGFNVGPPRSLERLRRQRVDQFVRNRQLDRLIAEMGTDEMD